MPLYEYKCDACGAVVEALQRMSDPPLRTCESCGGDLRRLISAPAFQFKGSGWYVTDYAGKGEKGDQAGTSDQAGKADGAESTSKDGDKKKPAASDASSGDSSSSKKATTSGDAAS